MNSTNRLKLCRVALGLSQAEVAERAGTHQPYLSQIEKGHAPITPDMRARLAEALGLPELLIAGDLPKDRHEQVQEAREALARALGDSQPAADGTSAN